MSETSQEASFEDVIVSVILPYSEAHTPPEMLEEAVDSAQSQVGVETDVLIIEDEDQRGPAWARNVGLDQVETRYVAFLDADDLWDNTKLVEQLQEMKATGAGLCVDGQKEYSPLEFARALLTGETFALTSTILIDTEQVDIRFDETLERREDHLFMIEAATTAGVCFSGDTYTERLLESGMTRQVDSSPEEIHRFYESLTDRVPEAKALKQPYYQDAFVYLGVLRHRKREYRAAIRAYAESMKYGVNIQAIGATGLTLLKMAYEYPTRPARRLLGGGSYE